MPRISKELGALQVARLRTPGLHAVGGVAGLHLQISDSGARSWILKVKVNGRRREMGLGGYADVSLADAREAARTARATIASGVDPIMQAKAAKSELLAASAKAVTFRDAATKYLAAHSPGWRNAKHGQQWENTLATYAHPAIGSLLVRDITMAHILKILEPIWTEKTETASRVRGRIESVLDWAKGRGYRTGDNPAAWKGNLSAQLAAPKKVSKVTHHAALPLNEVGAFMVALRQREGMAGRALEFAILTAARSGEVRGALWTEIDMDANVWTIPAERMKMGQPHRVPLSESAIRILHDLPRLHEVELVFPAPRGGPLSDMTLTAVMRRMKVAAVPHGFRSTFRDWAGERTNYPREVAEMALAHKVGDETEAAYWRGDLFDKRSRMMADWAKFCTTVLHKSEVVPMNKSKRG